MKVKIEREWGGGADYYEYKNLYPIPEPIPNYATVVCLISMRNTNIISYQIYFKRTNFVLLILPLDSIN